MKTIEQDVFKPFLVEGGRDGKNIFRIVKMTQGVTREQIEKLLEKLPIGFHLREDSSIGGENINEPLEVYAEGAVISIYPPRHRINVCTTFDSWRSADVVSKMHVDNIMDTESPGHGQLRTCVHFDPAIFGIDGWPESAVNPEIEVDIFVYPAGKEDEPKLEVPSFGKLEVRKLLELIAGGERRLTVKQLNEWRSLIMYAVWSMRYRYENPDVAKDYEVRLYYQPCWAEIEAAGGNDEKLIEALGSLRGMIEDE